MVRFRSTYRILTLQDSLEEVIRLGNDYLVSENWEEWRPRDLLAWLEQKHPDLLSLPVALVPPDANGDGAVFEVDQEGEPITDRPLYRIERRQPTVYPL
ncbi:MAG TPA: hypothetical protein VH593_22620 [Ktedonobacteraceae bacterium]